MNKKELKQQMREALEKLQHAPTGTHEERKEFHELQDAYNKLASEYFSL